MAKPLFIAIATAATVVSTTCFAPFAYADVHFAFHHSSQRFNHHNQGDGSWAASQWQGNENGAPVTFFGDDSSSGNTTQDASSNDGSTDVNQIITQFEQAIAPYQQNGHGKDHGKPFHPQRGKHAGGDDGKVPSPGPTSGTLGSLNAGTPPTSPATSLPTPLQPVTPKGRHGAPDKRRDGRPFHEHGLRRGKDNQIGSNKGATTKSTNSSGAVTVTESSTTQTDTAFQQSLSAYKVATGADASAQSALTSAVQSYIQTIDQAVKVSKTSLISATMNQASAVLSSLKAALVEQNQVNSEYRQLTAPNISASQALHLLQQMTIAEQSKATDLNSAVTSLQQATSSLSAGLA